MDEMSQKLAQIEEASGGRLGVAMLNTGSGKELVYHNESFPMCSTFKLLAVSALLAQVDAGREQLSRRLTFKKSDLVTHSPATEEHVGGKGMTLAALCKAAMTLSDNTAANLIVSCVGGPAGVTAYARSLSDTVTRLDRTEPDLNDIVPGDPRDTTTPLAMLEDLKTLVLGDALSLASREQLTSWMKDCKTGDERLRAGLPKDWVIGDKTGTLKNTANDIAVIWPPNRAPIVVTAFLTEAKVSDEECSKLLAAVGRAVAAEVVREGK